MIDLSSQDWLFMPEEVNDSSCESSTTGLFSPQALFNSSEQGSLFKQSIPNIPDRQRIPKMVVVNDFALAHCEMDVDGYLKKIDMLEELLEEKFELYLLRPNSAPQKLAIPLKIEDFTKAPIPELDPSQAAALLSPLLPDIHADQIAIMTNKRMNILTGMDNAYDLARQRTLLWHCKQTGELPLYEYPLMVSTSWLNQWGNTDLGRTIVKKIRSYAIIPSLRKKDESFAIEIDSIRKYINKSAKPLFICETPSEFYDVNIMIPVSREEQGASLEHFFNDRLYWSTQDIKKINEEADDHYIYSLTLASEKYSLNSLAFFLNESNAMITHLTINGSTILGRDNHETRCAIPHSNITHINVAYSDINGETLYELLKNKPQLKSIKFGKISSDTYKFKVNDKIILDNVTEIEFCEQNNYLYSTFQSFLEKTSQLEHLTLPVPYFNNIDFTHVPLENMKTLTIGNKAVRHSDAVAVLNEKALLAFLKRTPQLISLTANNIYISQKDFDWNSLPLSNLKVLKFRDSHVPVVKKLMRTVSTVHVTELHEEEVDNYPVKKLFIQSLETKKPPQESFPCLSRVHISSVKNNCQMSLVTRLKSFQFAREIKIGVVDNSFSAQDSASMENLTFPYLLKLDISDRNLVNAKEFIKYIVAHSPMLRELTVSSDLFLEDDTFPLTIISPHITCLNIIILNNDFIAESHHHLIAFLKRYRSISMVTVKFSDTYRWVKPEQYDRLWAEVRTLQDLYPHDKKVTATSKSTPVPPQATHTEKKAATATQSTPVPSQKTNADKKSSIATQSVLIASKKTNVDQKAPTPSTLAAPQTTHTVSNTTTTSTPIPSQTTQPDIVNITVEHGNRNPHKIYMRMQELPNRILLDTPSTKSQFTKVPVCESIDGSKPVFQDIRIKTFSLSFKGIQENTLLEDHMMHLYPFAFHLIPKLTGIHPENHLFNYPVSLQDFEWDKKLGKWVLPLWSLTPDDIIIGNVWLDKAEYEPQFCLNNTCHVIVLSKVPSVTQQIIFKCAVPKQANRTDMLPAEIQDLYRSLHQPFERHTGRPIQTTVKNIRAHIKHYRCEIRPFIFLYYLSKLKIPGLEDARTAMSGNHAWVQLSYHGKYYFLNLGGSAVEVTYKDILLTPPPIPAPPRQTRWTPDEMDSYSAFMEHIDKKCINTLFILKSRRAIQDASAFICSKYPEAVSVKQYNDIETTKRYMDVDLDKNTWIPCNPPGGWLSEQLDNPAQTHLIIHWQAFDARHSTQHNSCLDKGNRKIQGKDIQQQVHIIGFMLANDERLYDESFRERHDAIFSVPFTFSNSMSLGCKHSIPIEFYDSPYPIDTLLGTLLLENDKGVFEPGKLIANKIAENTELILSNPPKSSDTFNMLMTDLQNGNPIRYENKTLRFPRMKITTKRGYHFSNRDECIDQVYANVTTSQLPDVDFVLNPATFSRLIDNYVVSDNLYQRHPGWIESDKSNISCYITRALSIQQFSVLLDHAQQKRFTLYLAPGVKVPSGLNTPVFSCVKNGNVASHAQCIITNDCDQYIDNNMTENDLVVDVSEYTPDDILYRYVPCFHPETNAFSFEHIESPVLTALKNGQNVYLTGHFSPAMIDHLSTLLIPNGYIWQHLEKQPITGKLILVIPERLKLLHWVSSTETVIYDTVALPAPRIYEANEPDDAEGFEEARFDIVFEALKRHPAIFIVGDPGIGKSSFIHAFKQRVGEKNFDKYFKVIDEAPLHQTHYSKYTGLYRRFPHLALDPQDETKKFIFLGNHSKDMPALLATKMAKVIFRPLSSHFIIKRILQPIFDIDHKGDATHFYEKHYRQHSVRAMHAMAIAQGASLMAKHPAKALQQLPHFYITSSRKPLLDCLINTLNARHFMSTAKTDDDSPKYGGQTAIWIEGPPAIGKTELVERSLTALQYTAITDIEIDALEVGSITIDTQNRFYIMPAGCDPGLMLTRLRKAADQGLIVVFHEMDTALSNPLIAQLNAFLMGETLDFDRPTVPGFMLIGTGNGANELGRERLTGSLLSRCEVFRLDKYTDQELLDICCFTFRHLDRQTIEEHINKHDYYTFRKLKNTLVTLPPSPVPVVPAIPAPASFPLAINPFANPAPVPQHTSASRNPFVNLWNHTFNRRSGESSRSTPLKLFS